jgi:hypothetical protein
MPSHHSGIVNRYIFFNVFHKHAKLFLYYKHAEIHICWLKYSTPSSGLLHKNIQLSTCPPMCKLFRVQQIFLCHIYFYLTLFSQNHAGWNHIIHILFHRFIKFASQSLTRAKGVTLIKDCNARIKV